MRVFLLFCLLLSTSVAVAAESAVERVHGLLPVHHGHVHYGAGRVTRGTPPPGPFSGDFSGRVEAAYRKHLKDRSAHPAKDARERVLRRRQEMRQP